MEKVHMRIADADTRTHNFEEVALGYTEEEAKKEASRCLNCANPRCVKGCPVNIRIPEFIEAIKENDMQKAYEVIQASSSLPAVCGRVCPQEKQCEAMCIKGFKGDAISIGALERYVADYARENHLSLTKEIVKKNKKVAVIGAGPSGLSCAGELAKNGYEVTIFEALHKAGGVLTYGIPEFRLPKKIVEEEVDSLKKLGVKVELNAVIGKSLSLEDLQEEYDAIYLGTGAGLPKFMGIENENANEVFSANEVLTRINLMNAYKKDAMTPVKDSKVAVVVGGGNVAMDAARSLRRLGIEVHIVYRRDMDEMPARKAEVEHAMEEGIIFDTLKNPTRILKDEDNHVTGVELIAMEYAGESDGRKSVREIPDSHTIMNCDTIVMALGTSANDLATTDSKVERNERNLIIVDGTKTSEKGVFAGGDAVTGAATVILAMEAGKKGAAEIMEYLS